MAKNKIPILLVLSALKEKRKLMNQNANAKFVGYFDALIFLK